MVSTPPPLLKKVLTHPATELFVLMAVFGKEFGEE
jgi:hypothetical protein